MHDIHNEVNLTESDVESTLKLVPKMDQMLKYARFMRAFQRLLKSMQAYDSSEKSIELRIAMDSLFTGEEERFPNVLMRYNAALYLETDSTRRNQLRKEIQNFSTDASIIMHGGNWEKKKMEYGSQKNQGTLKKFKEFAARL